MNHRYAAVFCELRFCTSALDVASFGVDDFQNMLQAMTQAARSASDAAPALQALQVQQQCQLVTISIKPVVEWSDNLYNPLRSEDHEGDLST